jgi:hypothetical protein
MLGYKEPPRKDMRTCSALLWTCPHCKKILAVEDRRRHAPSLTLLGRARIDVNVTPKLKCLCGCVVTLSGVGA